MLIEEINNDIKETDNLSQETHGYKKLSKEEVIEIMSPLRIHFPEISEEMQRRIDINEFKW